MYCNKLSFEELRIVVIGIKLRIMHGISNRIKQRIMTIITSALIMVVMENDRLSPCILTSSIASWLCSYKSHQILFYPEHTF